MDPIVKSFLAVTEPLAYELAGILVVIGALIFLWMAALRGEKPYEFLVYVALAAAALVYYPTVLTAIHRAVDEVTVRLGQVPIDGTLTYSEALKRYSEAGAATVLKTYVKNILVNGLGSFLGFTPDPETAMVPFLVLATLVPSWLAVVRDSFLRVLEILAPFSLATMTLGRYGGATAWLKIYLTTAIWKPVSLLVLLLTMRYQWDFIKGGQEETLHHLANLLAIVTLHIGSLVFAALLVYRGAHVLAAMAVVINAPRQLPRPH